jgi:hypothetical protein
LLPLQPRSLRLPKKFFPQLAGYFAPFVIMELFRPEKAETFTEKDADWAVFDT